MRALFFAFSLAAVAFGSYANDSDRITQLENEVQELKSRLIKLESPQANTNNQQKTAPSSQGWKSLANWRALKKGMAYEDVRAILGEPERIAGGTFTSWYYKNQGEVTFYNDKLYSWSEPR